MSQRVLPKARTEKLQTVSGVTVSGCPEIAAMASGSEGLCQGRESRFIFRKGNTPMVSEDYYFSFFLIVCK